MCWRKRERWHSSHGVAPWNLGQKYIGHFSLMPICLKSSNSASQHQQRRLKLLTPVSLICWQQCQAQTQIPSGCQVSQTVEGPSRGFLGIYVPSTRRVIIKAWIFLLSWETKKDRLNSLNSSCQAVKYIPFMPVSCCLFSLCLFLQRSATCL